MELEGTQLSHYRLGPKLGQGGMGVVYRAFDERLQRNVAIKLLPPLMLEDPKAHARLLREARMASALSHPNVCTIFEASEANGQTFIVMELVEGRPLSQIVPGAGLPPQAVCRYGAQIAEALDHAHRRGVVHRDLKLANVMVTGEGHVKVLDFGLSRHGAQFGAVPEAADTSLMESGAFVGTPLYLAPEVWRGGTADERGDIWALGIVLFEMAAGRAPFSGSTEYELGAEIMNAEPAVMPEQVPASLATLIHRCLDKQPAHRFRTAAEVRAALEALATDPARTTTSLRPSLTHPFMVSAAAVIALAAIGVTWSVMHRSKTAGVPSPAQLTSNSAENPVVAAAISPDGKYLAYADRQGISLRLIETGETRSLPLPVGWEVSFPFPVPQLAWFPDGARLLANSGNGIWVISIQGGNPRRLVDGTAGGIVSPNGLQVAFVSDSGNALCQVSAEGQRLDTLARIPGISSPAWSPDGRWIAFLRADTAGARPHRERVWCYDTRARRVLSALSDSVAAGFAGEHRLEWLADDRLVLERDEESSRTLATNLWSVRVDARTGRPTEGPRRLTHQAGGVAGYPNASADGKRLVFLRWAAQSDVWVTDFEEGGTRLGAQRRLTLDDRMDDFCSWTPDSRAVLFSSDRNGTFDVFQQNLDDNLPRPLVTGPEAEGGALATPDGSALSYTSAPYSAGIPDWQRYRRLRVPTRGGEAREIAKADTIQIRSLRGREGRRVATGDMPSPQSGRILVISAWSADRGSVRELVRVDSVGSVSISPDSARIAFVRQTRSPEARGYISIIDVETGEQRKAGLGGGLEYEEATWAPDGKTLVGVASCGREEVIYRSAPEGKPTVLWRTEDVIHGVRPSPDGRHIAFTRITRVSNAWLMEGF